MSWVRIDDGFADHPKVVGLSDAAFRAHVRGMCYAARHRTDGHIPSAIVPTLAHTKALRELESSGVWDRNGTGYVIHDWLDYNRSRDELRSLSEVRAQAGRRGGQSKSRSK